MILIAQDLGDYGKERRGMHGLENLVAEMLKSQARFLAPLPLFIS